MQGDIEIIGIVSALKSEIEGFKEKLRDIKEINLKNHKFNVGYLDNKKIAFTDSGIGKVNAAIATQMLIDNFNPNIIINTGIAGGLDKKLKHTSLVVADELMYHDFDKRLLEEYYPFTKSFKVEKKYLEIAKNVLKNEEYFEGLIITGDQFISDSKVQLNLREEFGALCVEMEGAAIAHTSYANDIPFMVIRCISDFADDDGETDYDNLEIVAANKASKFTINFIKELK
ncbi:5'-methylthioadenosine/adenosylhomocysteine nucleosidase [Miniphocaeibacter massiliensis]|uniref:5'-methylthioadenosine/adenosylhomocysteine nucleosidase n=1 Tax=Miniphocaeibacter massiliensis TaxID=2041841 RepID=UPI000C0838A6|nr:5'-methylthioadenosine/adenosylhomocysteine nucleosidase [Miniphocaeibacter massiliensis]